MGLGTSGFKKLLEKIMKKYISKSDVFGSSNISEGGFYNPGLVPGGHPNFTEDLFLKGDGTWKKPIERSFGLAEISGSYSTQIEFEFVPTIVKVWDSDGKLVNISKNNPTGEDMAPEQIFGSCVFSDGNNTTSWTLNGAYGTYVYEAIKEY